MKRVMCIYLPGWPLQRLWHDQPALRAKSVAIYDPQAARKPQIVLCSCADQTAIRPGMPLAEVLAIDPRLHVVEYDPQADLEALGRLAEWAGRFSPMVAIEQARETEAPQSLLLDITGCAACFHGEEKLLEQAVREFRGQGWNACVAIADTVGGAWGLAHYGDTPSLAPPSQTECALSPLPVAALRLPSETVHWLAELGVERIRELIALPRSSLPVRLGPMVLNRLDQALGHLSEVLVPHRPLPMVEARLSFEYPTDHRDILGHALNQLTGQVCQILEERAQGAKQIECWLYHEIAEPLRLEVGLYRPSRSLRHLTMLLRTRLEPVVIEEPVCAMCLRVPITAARDVDQAEIFEAECAADFGELSRLVDQLTSRLGREAVTRARLVSDAQPEYSCCFEPVIAEVEKRKQKSLGRTDLESSKHNQPLGSSPHDKLRSTPARPMCLWGKPVLIPMTSVMPEGPPVRFRWAGTEHQIVRSWGPERIETGWWRGQDVHRDYYLVETVSGARFWIYRRRDDGRWFLHGCFD